MEAKDNIDVPLQIMREKKYPTLFLDLINEYQSAIQNQFWFFHEIKEEIFFIALLKEADNSEKSVQRQCRSILMLLFHFKNFYSLSKTSLTQKLIINVLMTYLVIGNPSQADYTSLIEWLYYQKHIHTFAESSIGQALIISVLAIKAHKLKTIEEISTCIEFLQKLNQEYGLGYNSPEGKFLEKLRAYQNNFDPLDNDFFETHLISEKILSHIESKALVIQLAKLHDKYGLTVNQWDQELFFNILKPTIDHDSYKPLTLEAAYWLRILLFFKTEVGFSAKLMKPLVEEILLQQAHRMPKENLSFDPEKQDRLPHFISSYLYTLYEMIRSFDYSGLIGEIFNIAIEKLDRRHPLYKIGGELKPFLIHYARNAKIYFNQRGRFLAEHNVVDAFIEHLHTCHLQKRLSEYDWPRYKRYIQILYDFKERYNLSSDSIESRLIEDTLNTIIGKISTASEAIALMSFLSALPAHKEEDKKLLSKVREDLFYKLDAFPGYADLKHLLIDPESEQSAEIKRGNIIDLSGIGLNDEDIVTLVKLLKKAPSISKLALADNAISKAGAQALANFLSDNKNLTELNLSRNINLGGGGLLPFSYSGAQLILEKLANNPSLNVLNLACTGLNVHDVNQLKNLLLATHHPLKHVSVYEPSEEAMELICQMTVELAKQNKLGINENQVWVDIRPLPIVKKSKPLFEDHLFKEALLPFDNSSKAQYSVNRDESIVTQIFFYLDDETLFFTVPCVNHDWYLLSEKLKTALKNIFLEPCLHFEKWEMKLREADFMLFLLQKGRFNDVIERDKIVWLNPTSLKLLRIAFIYYSAYFHDQHSKENQSVGNYLNLSMLRAETDTTLRQALVWEGIRQSMQDKHLTSQQLNLANCHLDTESFTQGLWLLPAMDHIRVLDLSENRFNDIKMSVFINDLRKLPRLNQLKLNHCQLPARIMASIVEAVKNHAELNHICLVNNHLAEGSIDPLITYLGDAKTAQQKLVQYWDLSENPLTRADGLKLLQALEPMYDLIILSPEDISIHSPKGNQFCIATGEDESLLYSVIDRNGQIKKRQPIANEELKGQLEPAECDALYEALHTSNLEKLKLFFPKLLNVTAKKGDTVEALEAVKAEFNLELVLKNTEIPEAIVGRIRFLTKQPVAPIFKEEDSELKVEMEIIQDRLLLWELTSHYWHALAQAITMEHSWQHFLIPLDKIFHSIPKKNQLLIAMAEDKKALHYNVLIRWQPYNESKN